MTRLSFLVLAAYCLCGVLSETHPTYLIREHRTNLQRLPVVQRVVPATKEFQVVAKDEYAVVEAEPTLGTNLMNLVLTPIKGLLNVGARFLPIARSAIANGIRVIIGMLSAIISCIFTSNCSISLDNPVPYLVDIQNLFSNAYDMFYRMLTVVATES